MTQPETDSPVRRHGSTRVRLIALGALLLTFAAGLALGWGMGHRWGGHGPRRRPPPPIHETFDRLDLTAEQRTAVDSIFAARRAQIAAFWEGPGQRLRILLDSTSSDVRSVLDSVQRSKYDAMQREGRPGRRPHGPPPGPPPPEPPPEGARFPAWGRPDAEPPKP